MFCACYLETDFGETRIGGKTALLVNYLTGCRLSIHIPKLWKQRPLGIFSSLFFCALSQNIVTYMSPLAVAKNISWLKRLYMSGEKMPEEKPFFSFLFWATTGWQQHVTVIPFVIHFPDNFKSFITKDTLILKGSSHKFPQLSE